MQLPKSLQSLIEHFESLPGIGTKTAERLAFYFVKAPTQEAKSFAQSLISVKEELRLCKLCGNISEGELCKVCADESRDKNVICVVENIMNLVALEKTGYEGVYHVLHGVLNPVSGVNVEDITLDSLFTRLTTPFFIELILATNPTMEGESTALYIKRKIDQLGLSNIKLTRIGRGIPTGGDIEFADKTTLDNALQGRRDF